MKILFIGNHAAEHSTENHHAKTFEKLGHTVIRIQENRTSVNAIAAELETEKPDMLYWTHTHSWKIDTHDKVSLLFMLCKKKGIPTVGYHLDLWRGLNRHSDLHTDPYWNIEHFFTVDKLMADYLNQYTQTKGYYLPAGVFEDECYMTEPDYKRYPHEIVFTGSKNYHPEFPYRPKLIDWLRKTYGSMFAHYGNGGGIPTVRGHDLNVLYASAKIVIGDTLCKNFDYPFYTSDRIFETLGRNGFIIYPRIRGLEFFYEDGKEVVYYNFNDFVQLKSLIDYYLVNDEERERIRLAGHLRTIKSHTYTVRLKSLLETLENEKI